MKKVFLLIVLSSLVGCATSRREIERRNKETVFQCKALCNNSTVEYIDVEGLRCICNLNRNNNANSNTVVPIIINNGGQSKASPSKAPNIINMIPRNGGVSMPNTVYSYHQQQNKQYVPVERLGAAKVVLPSGRTIISQAKEQ